ncbi:MULTISPECIES: hypothetical protein [unclassified Lysinibacillus]|uniref:hypothetical protein n=1 Tax=unclassified Lysinibacillus TaxID=2636778 RepID=UPI003814DE52
MAKNQPNKPDEEKTAPAQEATAEAKTTPVPMSEIGGEAPAPEKTAEETATLSHEDGAAPHESDKDGPEAPKPMDIPATTRLMTCHTGSGMTITETLKDGFDYGKNPNKTRNGDLILAYECDPATADAEFSLSKAKYKAIMGREQKRDNDVLYYQIR